MGQWVFLFFQQVTLINSCFLVKGFIAESAILAARRGELRRYIVGCAVMFVVGCCHLDSAALSIISVFVHASRVLTAEL